MMGGPVTKVNHEGCKLPGLAPGVGPSPCDVMFIGEALGEDEQRESKPFVGRAGKRLTVLVEKYLQRERSSVYITNLVKHRPPKNRKPKRHEIEACQGNLIAEIAAVKPKIIIAMGDTAINWFLAKKVGRKTIKAKTSVVHGRPQRLVDDHPYAAGVVLVPWYHPAAGFRSPKVLRAIVEDAKDYYLRLEQFTQRTERNYSLTSDVVAMAYAETSSVIGFDIETTAWEVGGGSRKAKRFGPIIGYSVSAAPNEGVYVDGGSLEYISMVLKDTSKTKICWNAKFEYKQLRKAGIEMRGFEDPMGLAYVLGYNELGLKPVSSKVLGVEVKEFKDVTLGVDLANPAALATRLRDNYDYGASDSDNTRRLFFLLREEARREQVLGVYETIERPLIPVLARIEERGVGVDVPRLQALQVRIAKIKTIAKRRAEALLRTELTHDKLARRLEELGAPIRKRTPGKRLLKTDLDTLERLRPWNPKMIGAVITYYRYEKLQAFPANLLSLVDDDGRVRTNLNQFGHTQDDSDAAPATGRLSSSTPNLQQIPHSGDPFLTWWGRRLRRCFLP